MKTFKKVILLGAALPLVAYVAASSVLGMAAAATIGLLVFLTHIEGTGV